MNDSSPCWCESDYGKLVPSPVATVHEGKKTTEAKKSKAREHTSAVMFMDGGSRRFEVMDQGFDRTHSLESISYLETLMTVCTAIQA